MEDGQAHIAKPIDVRVLFAKLKELLKQSTDCNRQSVFDIM
jgi:hypothetical protein